MYAGATEAAADGADATSSDTGDGAAAAVDAPAADTAVETLVGRLRARFQRASDAAGN